jgi:hypothetical protein
MNWPVRADKRLLGQFRERLSRAGKPPARCKDAPGCAGAGGLYNSRRRRHVGSRLNALTKWTLMAGRKTAAQSAAPPKTYGYVRVSTERQAHEGDSLEAQRRMIEGYCQMHDLTLDAIYVEEGVSGSISIGDRPEGAKLMAVLAKGDNIIASKLDKSISGSMGSPTPLRASRWYRATSDRRRG